MAGATVMLVEKESEKLEAFSISSDAGLFHIETNAKGDFVLSITYFDIGTFEKDIKLETVSEKVDFGQIKLDIGPEELEELKVEGFLPIRIKGDTVEYSADAFKTAPGATVEDLLKKLPGVEVEKDGTIKAEGEEVQQILIDGKDFFDKDPKAASKNLPADIVNKVQVYDKKSDFTEFTGIDDGEESKTINLKLKEGKKKGTFGTIKGEAGLEGEYLGAVNINRFDKKMQLTLLGNTNNINEQAFSFREYLNFSGGLGDLMRGGSWEALQIPASILTQSGQNTSYSGGINFNYDFTGKTSIRANYFGDLVENATSRISYSEQNNPESSYSTISDLDDSPENANHQVRLKFKHDIDSSQDLKIDSRIGLSNTSNKSRTQTRSFDGFGSEVNESENSNSGLVDRTSITADLTYRKKFKKVGRFFTAEGGISNTLAEGDQTFQSFLSSRSTTDIVAQRYLQKDDMRMPGHELKLDWVEPIGNARYLNFKTTRTAQLSNVNTDFTQDLPPLTFGWVAAPAPVDVDYDRSNTSHTGGLAIKEVRDQYTLSIGADYEWLEVKSEDQLLKRNFDRSFARLLPNADFNWSVGKSKSIKASYRTSLNVPSIDQMQPLADPSNPLSRFMGNPDLQAELAHRINLRFNSFSSFHFRAIGFGLTGRIVEDRIVNEESISTELISVITPVNDRDAFSGSGWYYISSPLKGMNLKFSYNGSLGYSPLDKLTNGVRYRNTVTTWSQTLRIENKLKNIIDWGIGAEAGSFFSVSNEVEIEDFNNTAIGLNADFVLPFAKTWTLESDAELTLLPEVSSRFDESYTLWNAKLNKGFMDNALNVYVSALNLLDQDLTINRNVSENRFSETRTNRLGRLFMLGVSYNLKSFGK